MSVYDVTVVLRFRFLLLKKKDTALLAELQLLYFRYFVVEYVVNIALHNNHSIPIVYGLFNATDDDDDDAPTTFCKMLDDVETIFIAPPPVAVDTIVGTITSSMIADDADIGKDDDVDIGLAVAMKVVVGGVLFEEYL